MTSWAKVGAKVVCISNDFMGTGSQSDAKKLIVGSVYTISFVGHSEIGGVYIRVRGIDCVSLGFRLDRFRPLVTRTQQQDVEMFLRLVDRVPSMETAQ